MVKKIYFAHPLVTWGTVVEKQIESVLRDRGYKVYNPFDNERKLLDKYNILSYYDNPTKEIASEIYKSDLNLVKKCDELFAWYPRDHIPIGTSIEVGWADCMKKPVTVIETQKHPFLLSISDKYYLGLKKFIVDKVF